MTDELVGDQLAQHEAMARALAAAYSGLPHGEWNPEPREEDRYADSIVAGDVINWAGRWLPVLRVEPVVPYRGTTKKHAVYLFVDAGNGPLRNHYYADERVHVREPEGAQQATVDEFESDAHERVWHMIAPVADTSDLSADSDG